MGLVFTWGQGYWQAPLVREDAVQATATYAFYEELRGRHFRLNEIALHFSDHEPVHVDGACINTAFRNRLADIRPDAQVGMLIHPNSNTILELTVNGDQLLQFDYVQNRLRTENRGFMWLALFCYAFSLYTLCRLYLWPQVKRRLTGTTQS